jgi:tRNA-Thr(GGU) m(6)t(6)A37 methyltransferase TsaA
MRHAGSAATDPLTLDPVGRVRSPLLAVEDAPRQGDEGAPAAWIEIEPRFREGLEGIGVGDELLVLTWLHQGRRDVLRVHPRGDPRNPVTGVFGTRSPDRPNPVGVHRVRVVERAPGRLRVDALEAVDGTPVIDLKPVLGGER